MELCRRLGVLDVETALREKRMAWVAHATRDRTENSALWIRNEMRIKSTWGRLVLQDFAHYGLVEEEFFAAPPDANTMKELMRKKRTVQTGRQRKTKQATENMTKRSEEQRARIQQQRRDNEQARASLLQKINGRRWGRVPSANGEGSWQLESDPEVRFTVTGEDFCENTGREIKDVAGQAFYRNQEGLWVAE